MTLDEPLMTLDESLMALDDPLMTLTIRWATPRYRASPPSTASSSCRRWETMCPELHLSPFRSPLSSVRPLHRKPLPLALAFCRWPPAHLPIAAHGDAARPCLLRRWRRRECIRSHALAACGRRERGRRRQGRRRAGGEGSGEAQRRRARRSPPQVCGSHDSRLIAC